MSNALNLTRSATVGRISYINVAPVYYGLDRGLKPDWMDLVTAPPAVLNRMLFETSIDLSPVSSAAYAMNHDKWLLLPDLSISCFGKVMSVLLVSKYPLDELDGKRVLLSDESASAAALVKCIFGKRRIQCKTFSAGISNPSDIETHADAALIIGDAALTVKWHETFNHVIDLGELWQEMTGLPFVFAVWAMRKEFALTYSDTVKDIIQLFRESKKEGDKNIQTIVGSSSEKTGLSLDVCEQYFDLLDCNLGNDHVKGLTTFFDELYKYGIVQSEVTPEFVK